MKTVSRVFAALAALPLAAAPATASAAGAKVYLGQCQEDCASSTPEQEALRRELASYYQDDINHWMAQARAALPAGMTVEVRFTDTDGITHENTGSKQNSLVSLPRTSRAAPCDRATP